MIFPREVEMEAESLPAAAEMAGLKPNITEGARVERTGERDFHLEIPAGPRGRYRLAQIDDYDSLPRRAFPHRPPFRFSLRARASAVSIPGTWGFGLWNNPFGMAILSGAELMRLPGLPDAAWFFFASPPNYLSLRDDLPADGWLASTFRSAKLPAPLLFVGLPALPFFLLPPGARLLRRLGRRFVRQDALSLPVDPTEWHAYELDWQAGGVSFQVDGQTMLESRVSPVGPLGLVLWVDNQYAALPPTGRPGFGTLPNPEPTWVEIRELSF
jgi:hypothetical protein